MTYDTSRQKVVLFGGLAIDDSGMNYTWGWDGSEWTQVAVNNWKKWTTIWSNTKLSRRIVEYRSRRIRMNIEITI